MRHPVILAAALLLTLGLAPAARAQVQGGAVGQCGAIVVGNSAKWTSNGCIGDGGSVAASAVTGPASAVSGNIATFNGATGKIIQDGGVALTALQIAPQGRLTLTTATPVLTATVSGATTIFYTPYAGNVVPIWNGTAFIPTACAELSNVTTNSAVGSAGPAAVANSSVYDLFVWANAGVCTLTRGPAWTNTTTRSAGTALTRQSGVLVNNATITNGPAATLGTYVGTVASNGAASIDYIFGAAASGGTAASLQVWNAYNRVSTSTTVTDSGIAYAYTVNTIRQARASAGNQIGFVVGLAEDTPVVGMSGEIALLAVAGGNGKFCVGFDSTTTCGFQRFILTDAAAVAINGSATLTAPWQPGIGVHTASANEQGDGANANNFDANSTNNLFATLRN